MQHIAEDDFELIVDHTSLAAAVGKATLTRAHSYADSGAVESVYWNPARRTLSAAVWGSEIEPYDVDVQLAAGAAGVLRFESGTCTCPVAWNCKHVAAAVLDATEPAPIEPAAVRPASGPAWQQSLGGLLLASWPGGAPGAEPTPLALELTLTAAPARYGDPAGLRLLARVVRPGKNGGWIAGGLSWTKLPGLNHYDGYRADHVRLLCELHAVQGSGRRQSGYSSYYGEEKTVDLGQYPSPRLWPLLAAARELGIALVGPSRRHPQPVPPGLAHVHVDLTGAGAGGEALALRAVARLEDRAGAVPVLCIGGTAAHGLVFVDVAEMSAGSDPATWIPRLAALDHPVPAALQSLLLSGSAVEIPAADRTQFAAEYYPQLRQVAAVASSDGAFAPPVISGPELVLKASYSAGHRLALEWLVSYTVDDHELRVAVGEPPAAAHRDPAAEARLLGEVAGELLPAGLADASTLVPYPRSQLTGLATMRFSTEILPLLRDRAGVRLEISGLAADYREAGDSLQIGVSTKSRAQDGDWFDLGVTVTVEGRKVNFGELFLALAQGEPHLLLADGAYFSLEKPALQALRRLIEEARSLAERPEGPLRISRFQTGLWEELAALGVVERQAAAWRKHVEGLRALASVGSTPVPDGLQANLRPYQIEGFEWLAFLWAHRLGGILADDMGLGKTLQALALICHARAAEPALPPFLIVAPTSVVGNWAAEAAKFAPGLRVVAVTETARRSGVDLADRVAGADVVVTSYALFRIDNDAYAGLDWAGLLLDEAQFVKNRQSLAYQCVRKLPTPFKIAITGTPMENSLMELWALLSVGAPGLFPSPTRFKEYYATPIEKGDPELLDQLRRRIKPLVKRRRKEDVARELPAKQEQVVEVELDAKHRRIYDLHLHRERQKILGLLDDLDGNRFAILRSLTLLRQLSLHPGLVEDEQRHASSAKIDALLEHVHAVAGTGHRTLVFSQFTGMLGLLRERLDAAGVEYCYLDGKTRHRSQVVESFKQGDAPLFLISLKAGGFGLNLTEADYCVLLDPWWNPATEAQAVDRTHRIGQTRNVMVYRLIAKDTIEAKVVALKERKAELFAGVMDNGDAFGSRLEAEDIRGLFA